MKTLKNKNYQRIDNKILDAYKQELLNGTYDKVSITDLCKKAGINRTTFYKHYTKTDDVFFRLQDDFTEEHFTFKESGSYKEFLKDPKKYLKTLAERTLGDAKYIEKLFHPHYVYRIMHQIEDNIFKEIKRLFPQYIKKYGECVIRTDLCYFVGGSFAIIEAFIKKELPCITEEYIINEIGDALIIGLSDYKKKL